jgi:hypothetical protein
MRRARRIGCGLALVLAGASCDSGGVAGGTFETENLSALVIRTDSIAPFAQRLGWHPIVATVRLDSRNFDFERAGPHGDDLVVERMDGTPIPFAIHRWEAKERWARIQVRLEGDLLRKGSCFRLRSAITLPLSDSAAVWEWIPDSLRERWTSVLVDDFEHGDTRNLLPIRATWYTKKVDSATITAPMLVPAGGTRTGTALGFEYHAPPPWPVYVLLGTTIASHPVDFGSLDSIVFWAKGNGILSVSLDIHSALGDTTKTWMHDDLDTAWTRWRVRPQDFDPPGSTGGNLGWKSVHDSITTLSIFASGSGSVMLDDIRFFGMHDDDFR